MSTGNYFGPGVDAGRYAKARPSVHSSAIERFRLAARIAVPFARALDVGCGTGHSTVALASIADSVVGVDPSTEMLSHAVAHSKVRYQRASAESLPFPDGGFDLITAALAFHWFDASAFLAESRRVLRSPGWLLIYTSGFTGEVLEEPAFSAWFRGEFLTRYPTPARKSTVLNPSLAEGNGLAWVGEESFSNDVEMTIDTFVDYELSTTNIIAAAERSHLELRQAEAWMRESLVSLLTPRHKGTFRFVGKAVFLKKQAG
ncbi:MAG: class I SAM-dependent methyltransferase [Vicinamibacterales bacterium]